MHDKRPGMMNQETVCHRLDDGRFSHMGKAYRTYTAS